MVLPTEGFAANVTRIGPLVGVRALVDKQIVGFCELTIAILANELLLWTRSGTGGF